MNEKKIFNTIGCCGIDCGLCPRFYTKGDSVCPGCGGLDFKKKHPSCGIHTCCFMKKKIEVCADCTEYPCKKFDAEKSGHDSFVTHKKVFKNLDFIKENGIELFLKNQFKRIEILKNFLKNFDDGRSKSYFCLCCTLLPVDALDEAIRFACNLSEEMVLKDRNLRIKQFLKNKADNLKIDIKLNQKEKEAKHNKKCHKKL